MVEKEYIFTYLRDLSQNNSKDWMDDNRERYHKANERWLYEESDILNRLSEHDSYFQSFNAKDVIMRINNKRQFHQNRPLYKDYFGCAPTRKKDAVSKLHIAAGLSWSFIGGGLWRPDSKNLNKVRKAIAENGDELIEIVEDPDKLKTSPQNYKNDHKYIDLLRYKSITAQINLTQKIVISDGFTDFVEETYLKLRPLTDFLEKAVA